MFDTSSVIVVQACTQHLQLVVKVRVPPNNGFAHEEQISGTIYLSGALCECVCSYTRKRLLDI